MLRDYHYLGDLPNIVTSGLLLMFQFRERMFSLSGEQPTILLLPTGDQNLHVWFECSRSHSYSHFLTVTFLIGFFLLPVLDTNNSAIIYDPRN